MFTFSVSRHWVWAELFTLIVPCMSADRGFWLSVCLDSCSRVSTPHKCTTGNVNHDHLWNLAPVTLRLVKSHYKTPSVLNGFYKVKRDPFISLNNDVSLFVCSKKNDYQRSIIKAYSLVHGC